MCLGVYHDVVSFLSSQVWICHEVKFNTSFYSAAADTDSESDFQTVLGYIHNTAEVKVH